MGLVTLGRPRSSLALRHVRTQRGDSAASQGGALTGCHACQGPAVGLQAPTAGAYASRHTARAPQATPPTFLLHSLFAQSAHQPPAEGADPHLGRLAAPLPRPL